MSRIYFLKFDLTHKRHMLVKAFSVLSFCFFILTVFIQNCTLVAYKFAFNKLPIFPYVIYIYPKRQRGYFFHLPNPALYFSGVTEYLFLNFLIKCEQSGNPHFIAVLVTDSPFSKSRLAFCSLI